MTTYDGGSAFPAGTGVRPGMSLRDYFAAHALTGIIAAELWDEVKAKADDWKLCAEHAYNAADAMLEAREPKP